MDPNQAPLTQNQFQSPAPPVRTLSNQALEAQESNARQQRDLAAANLMKASKGYYGYVPPLTKSMLDAKEV